MFVTVTAEVAVNEPLVAVIVVTPTFSAVNAPLLSMLATVGSDDDHPTDDVRSTVERSERDSVAVKFMVAPTANVADAGDRPRPVIVAAEDFAVTLALPVLLLIVALMVAEPCALVTTVPLLLTVATDASEVAQETLAVTSLLVASL